MNAQSQQKSEVSTRIKIAYEHFKNGAFRDAEKELEETLSQEFENAEIISALKSAGFWAERDSKYHDIEDEFERGEYLFKQWRAYLRFLERDENTFEQGIFAIKQWVFGRALGDFLALLGGPAGSDPDVLYRIGICYKGKGNYKQALEYFEICNHQKADDPQILAALADCYAFINEVKAAKIFFREAFFIDPQQIDMTSLESLMVQRLVARLIEMGYTPPELLEWVPVYGVLFGVFNVKRELRSLEYGKLKQSIFSLHSQINDEGKRDYATEPRLLNRYFWLIDHYLASGDSREKVDDALQRIREINSSIYEQYIN